MTTDNPTLNAFNMAGKRGIIFGIANERSYAWYITEALKNAGAECLFTHLPGEKNKMRVTRALAALGIEDPWLFEFDAANDEDFDNLFDAVKDQFGTIDFIVHSIAYCDKDYLQVGQFSSTPRKVWTQAMEISAYSLIAMGRHAVDLMPNGGSIISLSYYGAEKVVPGYNVMGVAKAALEHNTRYLAMELGSLNIRVNCISGGPLRTLSAMAVGSIEQIMNHAEKFAPLRRNIEGHEAGNTALFLLSQASSGITGEIVYLDAGYNILSNFPSCDCEPKPDEKPFY